MSWVKQHRRARSNATNYTHSQAQKRIDEALPSFQKKIQNSLSVNDVGAIVFRKISTGRVCSCKGVIEVEGFTHEASDGNEESIVSGSFDNDLFGDRFGDHGINNTMSDSHQGSGIDALDSDDDYEEFDDKDMDALTIIEASGVDGDVSIKDHVLNSGNSVKCGICYKTGVQPGFEPMGFSRNVLTTYDSVDQEFYTVNNKKLPAEFQPLDEDAWVEFEVVVPKYFREALIGVWNNCDMYYPELFKADGSALTRNDLNVAKGSTIRFRIFNTLFTHVVFMFDQGVDPMKVNIGGESRRLDFETDLVVGNLALIGPEQLGLVNAGDVIVIPERNLFLLATDVPQKQTAKREQWEWEVQTRTIQPSELLRNLYRYQRLAQ